MEVKFIEILGYTIALIAFCPYVIINFLPAYTVSASLFILMYFINPVYCIMVGIVAGRDVKKRLVYIFLPAIVFIVSYSVIFNFWEPGFIFYGLVYLIISSAALLITEYIKKRNEKLYG
ncbi:MAG: hypothetical protein ACOX1F_03665 [Erysipelotrichaceae bacterium]|jgi:hypothetical protein